MDYDFSKRGKVSIWASQHPYAEVPDAYFEESFSHKKTRATNSWSKNFNLRFFNPENMETNGVHEGTIALKKAVGECSFSTSYIKGLLSKARKKTMEDVSWVILLFDYEYSAKISGVTKDNYMTFLGAFDYNGEAENVYETE